MQICYIPLKIVPFDGASVPLDSASALACASQLKVRSKNPKSFKYWLCQWPTGKIINVFTKQQQRGRWRYLSLLAQSVGARFPL